MAFAISPELQGYLDKLKGSTFEKTIPWMYVDTTKNVTVGVGHNLTSHQDYAGMDFIVKRRERKAVRGGDKGIPIDATLKLDRPATSIEIKNDYDFLKKHVGLGNYSPDQLAAYTTLELSSAGIEKAFQADLQDAISIAVNTFPNFRQFPVPCQAALIDIAFNTGGFKTFVTIVSALKGEGANKTKTWKERCTIAANHCERGAVSDDRNTTVKDWFLKAADMKMPA